MGDYDPADNSAKSYAVAIEAMREKLASFRREVIGDCTLYLGDCREVLPLLPQVDHVITDPPYSEAVSKGARTRNDDKFDGDALVPFSIAPDDLMSVLQLGSGRCRRWLLASIDWRHGLALQDKPPTGMRFVRAAVWVKPNSAPQFTGDRPAPGWEFVAVLHREGGERMRWNAGGKRGVWTSVVERGSGHPTQKPVPLMMEWVEDFTDRGETVLDPFMGSGTTGIACVRLGRKFIGIEIDENYFNIACLRIAHAYAQPDLFVEVAAKPEQMDMLKEVG